MFSRRISLRCLAKFHRCSSRGIRGVRHAASARPYTNVKLPIFNIIPEIIKNTRTSRNLVVQAPPGAGKTTMVPLAMLDSVPVEGKIIVLQPRRIACIAAARRLAELWGEPLGQAVGYRMRHESITSNRTKLVVVTEGILVRMFHRDPSLQGVSCVFFDEFHERSLDADLSLALCIAVQRSRNPHLRLIVMSATLGSLGQQVSFLLKDCPLISSEGRCFPVEVIHVGNMAELATRESVVNQLMERRVAETVRSAIDEHEGDILVFLPGEKEIMYTWIFLNNMGIGDGLPPKRLIGWAHKLIDRGAVDLRRQIKVCPLYGNLDQAEQDGVLQSGERGWRKVILASPIAESSITVPGVRVVVDCGLRRVKVNEPATCMSYMQTIPISVASAEQRRGRAGRIERGVCYRLWSQSEHFKMSANDSPELHQEDLAACVLDLAIAGFSCDDAVCSLPWLDAPRKDALAAARNLLLRLQALKREACGNWLLTDRGRQLGRLPVHPRLGHMILQAREVSHNFACVACDLAALLAEKELLKGGRVTHGADLQGRLSTLHNPRTEGIFEHVRKRVLQASEQLQFLAELTMHGSRPWKSAVAYPTCVLVAWAFPELVATVKGKGRGRNSEIFFSMHNGKRVKLDRGDALSQHKHLSVAVLTGSKVFWATRACPTILGSYGISINDPTKHLVFSDPWMAKYEDIKKGAKPSDQVTRLEATLVAKTRLCPSFPSGHCHAGDSCHLAHSSAELLESIAGNAQAVPKQDLVALLWDLGRLKSPLKQLMLSLAKQVSMLRHEYSPIDLAEVTCSLAMAKAKENSILDAIAEVLAARVNELPFDSEGGNLSAVLWAYTELNQVHVELFRAMAHKAAAVMKSFRPAVLSDCMEICFWSFHRPSAKSWSNEPWSVRAEDLSLINDSESTNGFAHKTFFELLAPIAIDALPEIPSISCVYMMWTYAKAGAWSRELPSKIALRIGDAVSQLDRCGLTMYVWSFSYMRIAMPDVYQLVSADTLRPTRMAEMAPRDVACMAFAFARVQIRDTHLFAELAKHSLGLVQDGIAQACFQNASKSLSRPVYEGDKSAVQGAVDAFDMMTIAELLSAYMDIDVDIPELFKFCGDYMAKGLVQRDDIADRFIRYPEALVKVLNAYAHFRNTHVALFHAMIPHSLRHLHKLRSYNLLKFMCCWATLGVLDDRLSSALDTALATHLRNKDIRGLRKRDIADAARALSAMNLHNGVSMALLPRATSDTGEVTDQIHFVLAKKLDK